ncbi:MAG: tRNA (adenosine(37)-N6)-threonylcarbamoyltransferase complex ATPase subunit type 1 TsaE [Rhodothermales bacterium]|nr:tRNA (adenosine(37)-N6)-threonylcarbamoyltransferase complex ATPase subunit type 1 TsaE [Rhodothermales bacterium]
MNANISSETTSPEETVQLGSTLAGRLKPGSIVALYGDLGSGKTHLTKGICAGLGIDPEHVTSPTFALINEYRGGRMPVYHFDTYRLKNLAEFMALGYEDYFEGDGVCLIEWPEPIESLLPNDVIRIRLKHGGGDRRAIEIQAWRSHGE